MRDKGKDKTDEIPRTRKQLRTETHFQGNVFRKGEFFCVAYCLERIWNCCCCICENRMIGICDKKGLHRDG